MNSMIQQLVRLDGDGKTAEISNGIDLDSMLNYKTFKKATVKWFRLTQGHGRSFLTFDIIEHSRSEYGRLSDMKELFSGLPFKVSDTYEKILDQSGEKRQIENLLEIVLGHDLYRLTKPI